MGFSSDATPDYGITNESLTQLRDELMELSDILGNAKAAKALQITPRQFSLFRSSKMSNNSMAHTLLSRLPAAIAQTQKPCEDGNREIELFARWLKTWPKRGGNSAWRGRFQFKA